jgi:dsDNA-specific endonuclease/ATPase MutS2
VRKALKQNKNITSWEEGKDGEGGDGVTVVKFEDA